MEGFRILVDLARFHFTKSISSIQYYIRDALLLICQISSPQTKITCHVFIAFRLIHLLSPVTSNTIGQFHAFLHLPIKRHHQFTRGFAKFHLRRCYRTHRHTRCCRLMLRGKCSLDCAKNQQQQKKRQTLLCSTMISAQIRLFKTPNAEGPAWTTFFVLPLVAKFPPELTAPFNAVMLKSLSLFEFAFRRRRRRVDSPNIETTPCCCRRLSLRVHAILPMKSRLVGE